MGAVSIEGDEEGKVSPANGPDALPTDGVAVDPDGQRAAVVSSDSELRAWTRVNEVTEPILRSDGVTKSERYLQRLCERSFLRLWSYPGVYRNQGTASGRDGKEVCDLLVVFENHVIIFSDKDCAFPNTGDPRLEWSRWVRRAVEEAARSTWGAERWIREAPDRLFLDRACTKAFPIALPPKDKLKVHRIVVARGAAARCRAELGGIGSLLICPRVIGAMHHADTAMPFMVGEMDPSRGYVHVLDDASVDLLLTELNTISDFVAYLDRKEAFIRSGRLEMAAGEEELLAVYLRGLNADGVHDFVVPSGEGGVILDVGFWDAFLKSPERRARQEADGVSELWDQVLARFVEHLMTATQYFGSGGVRDQEQVFRFMARENRTRRRMLSQALLEIMAKTSPDAPGARVIAPSHPGDPYYVFVLVPHAKGQAPDEYRELRAKLLYAYCMAVKVVAPDARDIVGFGTESGFKPPHGRSEDLFYLDASEWTPEQQKHAEEIREGMNLLKETRMSAAVVKEFPVDKPVPRGMKMRGSERNNPCPCGSGRKFKKCHGS